MEVAAMDELSTIDIAWNLLRTFVARRDDAKSAWKAGLRGSHFVRVGFDWSVDDLLKQLCEPARRDLKALREDYPKFFASVD
jgi:hypothetical protein